MTANQLELQHHIPITWDELEGKQSVFVSVHSYVYTCMFVHVCVCVCVCVCVFNRDSPGTTEFVKSNNTEHRA
jgi:hypothetical protein